MLNNHIYTCNSQIISKNTNKKYSITNFCSYIRIIARFQTMNCRFFKYLLLVFTVAAVKAKCESKNQAKQSIHQPVFGTASYTNRENNRTPAIYFLGTYGSVQICRSQTQRTVSFFKSPFSYSTKYNTYFQFLSNIFRHTSAGYVRLCKLILFPFHVFWWYTVVKDIWTINFTSRLDIPGG